MKKVFSVLTVAVLAVSTVFAGLSGEFSADYTADFAKESYGFNNNAGFKMTFDATTGSTANEKDVYAKLAGEFTLGDLDRTGLLIGDFELKEASINGENWKVDLTKMEEVGNFAGGIVKREYDSVKHKSAAQNLDAEVKTTNGVTAVYDGWTLGLGMNFAPAKTVYTEVKPGVKVDAIDKTLLYVKNEKGDFIPSEIGIDKVDQAALYTKKDVPASKALAASFGMKELALLDDTLKINASTAVNVASGKQLTFGLGAKVAYAQDKLSASVATDMIVPVVDNKADFKADVAADFAYDFVNAGVYYATDAVSVVKNKRYNAVENLLDVKLGVDLKSLNVPVALDVVLRDLVNEAGRGLDVAVSSDFMEGASVGANFGMNFKAKTYNAGVKASYDLKDIAKFSAEVGLKGGEKLTDVSLSVAAENTTLIENATLKLEYASENFLNEKKAPGALTASVGIKF